MAKSRTPSAVGTTPTVQRITPSSGQRPIEHPHDTRVAIFGEPFILELEDGMWTLRHRYWSLVGMGRTKAEAMTDLLLGAKDVAPFYLSEPDKSLTPDAVRLKSFLHQYCS